VNLDRELGPNRNDKFSIFLDDLILDKNIINSKSEGYIWMTFSDTFLLGHWFVSYLHENDYLFSCDSRSNYGSTSL